MKSFSKKDLATSVAYVRPADLNGFLTEQLKLKKEQGLRSGIFTENEVNNIFNLFDLKKEGAISKDRCIKAIQTMANSSFQFDAAKLAEIPETVDSFTFNKICQNVLGFSNKEFSSIKK